MYTCQKVDVYMCKYVKILLSMELIQNLMPVRRTKNISLCLNSTHPKSDANDVPFFLEK